jgi:hypothetical protein
MEVVISQPSLLVSQQLIAGGLRRPFADLMARKKAAGFQGFGVLEPAARETASR